MSDFLVRFRHTQGDIGPLKYPGEATVQQIKDSLLADWPKEGPLAKEPPHSANDIKVILGGKFLEGHQHLDELRASMGDPKADTVVTMHLVVRAASAEKQTGKSKDPDASQGCSCCIQ